MSKRHFRQPLTPDYASGVLRVVTSAETCAELRTRLADDGCNRKECELWAQLFETFAGGAPTSASEALSARARRRLFRRDFQPFRAHGRRHGMSVAQDPGDDEEFQRFVYEVTGGAPVSRDELWQLREEYDELHRDGEDEESE